MIAATGNGDKDAEAPKSRKRARKEEVCVQGERLQFTFRYRKTLPRHVKTVSTDRTVAVRKLGFRQERAPPRVCARA